MEVEVRGGIITEEEKQAYVSYAKEAHRDCTIDRIIITVEDAEFVSIRSFLRPVKFERVRRITGYLVGSLDRFNNGKKAEVSDRVHHGFDDDYYKQYSGLIDD